MNDNWKKIISLFLTGQAISMFGSMLVGYAITWHITLTTSSGIMMTLSILCSFLPNFIISPFAGVWADRYNRKVIIIVSDAMIAFATLILALLFIFGYDMIWLLFVISAIRSFGSGIQSPAVSSYIPHLVPSENLTKVNSIHNSINSAISLLSPMLSGFLLTFSSIEIIFFIDIITALIAIFIIIIFMVDVKSRDESVKITYFKDLQNGLRYIYHHKYLRYYCLFSIFFYVLLAPLAFLTPLQVSRNFGDEVWRLTLIEIAFSGGMIIGGLIIGAWGGFANKVRSMSIANALLAVFTISIGIISNTFWYYLLAMLLMGLVVPLFNIPAIVLIQQNVDKDYLGRVFGVISMLASIMMPIGMLGFGPLADLIQIEWLLLIAGFFMFFLSLLMYINKTMNNAAKPVVQSSV